MKILIITNDIFFFFSPFSCPIVFCLPTVRVSKKYNKLFIDIKIRKKIMVAKYDVLLNTCLHYLVNVNLPFEYAAIYLIDLMRPVFRNATLTPRDLFLLLPSISEPFLHGNVNQLKSEIKFNIITWRRY